MTSAVTRQGGPVALVPVRLIELRPSGSAMLVYCHLAKRADRENRFAWPSRNTLADDAGLSVNTVDKALSELRRLGAIEVVRRYRDDGGQTSNGYRLLSLPDEDEGATKTLPTPPSAERAEPSLPNLVGGQEEPCEARSMRSKNKTTTLGGGSPAANPPPSLVDVPLGDDPYWQANAATLTRLRTAGVPDELLAVDFARRLDALTEGTRVFWDDQMIQYQAWWQEQPPRARHRRRRRAFTTWIARQVASDNYSKRQEVARAQTNGYRR